MHAFTEIEVPNPRPFKRSFAIVAGLNGFLVLVFLISFGSPGSPEALGGAIWLLLFPALIAGLVAGFAARRSDKSWPTWKYAVVLIPIDLLFLLGNASAVSSP